MDAILSLVSGLIRSAAFLFILTLIGKALLPVAYPGNNGMKGAAVIVLVSWFSILLEVPLSVIPVPLLLLTGAALLFKKAPLIHDKTLCWTDLTTFALFYTVAFLFILPPAGEAYLPIVKIANTDLLNYMNTASYLLRLGPGNVATLPNIDLRTMIYGFTPGVHAALAWMSFFYLGDVMQTMMPFLFMIVALISCTITRLCESIFAISRPLAIGIAVIIISGPYFRYIVHFYFLSSLVGMLLFLLILSEAVRHCENFAEARGTLFSKAPGLPWPTANAGGPRNDVMRHLPYYFLLFYCYPPLFIITIAFQVALCILLYYSQIKFMLFSLFAIILSTSIVLLIDPYHTLSVFHFFTRIISPSITGWPLSYISPLALLGLPSPLELASPVLVIIGAGLIIFIGIIGLKKRAFTNAVSQSIIIMAIVSVVCFYIYAFLLGPSYQQWKFGSYLALPLSFVFWSIIAHLNRSDIFVAICLLILGGNMVWHITHDPKSEYYSSDYAKLRLIEHLVSEQDMDINMAEFTTNYLPAYFIRNKTLHFMSPASYPMEAHKPGRPYFIEGPPCNTPLDAIGCLYTSNARENTLQ